MAEPNVRPPKDPYVEAETFVCQNCGGIMRFDIKTQRFACASCKTEYDLQTLSSEVKEYDFNQYLAREAASVPFEDRAVVTCQACGLEMTLEANQVAAICPMCASTQIVTAKQRAGIPPEGIVPFQIDRQDAQRRFRAWVKSRWFAPNDFKTKCGEGALSGLYLPFWTYDASVLSEYRGEGGQNREEKDKDGKTRTVVDWHSVHGVVTNAFDDVLVCASEKEKDITGILPYNTAANAKPYAPGYLSGYNAELYKIKADQAFEKAKHIMDANMRDLAERKILSRYDQARVHSLRSVFSSVTYKHVLLPVWSSAYGYKGRTFAYLVNGETGKVSGQRPYSAPKIIAAIAAMVAIVALLIRYL